MLTSPISPFWSVRGGFAGLSVCHFVSRAIFIRFPVQSSAYKIALLDECRQAAGCAEQVSRPI